MEHNKPMEFKKPEEEQTVYTPLGSTMKPVDFNVGQFVKTKNLPGVWVVLQALGDNKYRIGREGAIQELNAEDLTITDEEV